MYQMNETINKIMPDIYYAGNAFKQPGFTHSACGPFTKNKERIKKLRKQEIPDVFVKIN